MPTTVSPRRQSPVPTVIGCLLLQLCVGILYLWSVFKNPIIATFGLGGDAATMISSYMLFGFVLGVLGGGILNDKKGPRPTAVTGMLLFSVGVFLTGLLKPGNIGLMVLTYCAMGGLGSGFTYAACVSCIQKWMPHRRGFASGLAVSAFGLSTVVFAPVSEALMSAFKTGTALVGGVETMTVNFFGVFSVLAAVFFAVGMICCIFVRLPSESYIAGLGLPASATSDVRNYTLKEAIRTTPFWCLFFCSFFINGVWNLAVPLIKPLGLERGLTAAAATFAVSFTGIPNAAGRLVMATLSDKIGRRGAVYILSALNLLGALLMTFVTGLPYIVTVSLLAFAYGGPAAVSAAYTTDFFGPKYSGTNYGIITLSVGLSSVVFNLISTKLLSSAVTPTFIMGAVTSAVPALLMLVLARCEKTWKRTV